MIYNAVISTKLYKLKLIHKAMDLIRHRKAADAVSYWDMSNQLCSHMKIDMS